MELKLIFKGEKGKTKEQYYVHWKNKNPRISGSALFKPVLFKGTP